MVVKSQLKLIKSLQQKKYRNQYGLFVAEGIKVVGELLQSSFVPHQIYTSDASELLGITDSFIKVSEKELKQMSGLRAPNKVLGVFGMTEPEPVDFEDWILVVDTVQDPGNLGTIIRLCDWFNIRHLVCSSGTVDKYNPKVLQATMGSIARVNVVHMDLVQFLRDVPLPIYGAFADGISMYGLALPPSGVL
ncbi:MAG: TrmH family RNA methyltransferase, partial [Flavobacteriaceae bacterium]